MIFLPLLFASALHAQTVPHANKAEAPVAQEPTPAPAPEPVAVKHNFVGWSALVPAFVIHGTEPGGDAAEAMPRKLDPGGRSVFTPGLGFEYKAENSFNFLVGFLKDCYDDPAGAIQAGQHWPLGEHFDWGYTLGLYVRQTPITCYTTTTTVQSSQGPIPPGGHLLPGLNRNNGRPGTVNSFSSETCLFSDNLPIRYTFEGLGTYIDVIPTPFLNLSASLLRGPVNIDAKLMTNFYLNEFGLSISL